MAKEFPDDATSAAVIGCGPVGLMAILAAQAQGAQKVSSATQTQRVFGRTLKCTTQSSRCPRYNDTLFEATGCRPAGVMAVLTAQAQGAQKVSSLAHIHFFEYTYCVHLTCLRTHTQCLERFVVAQLDSCQTVAA